MPKWQTTYWTAPAYKEPRLLLSKWPEEKILEMFRRAFDTGLAETDLPSEREAQLFRFAIKNRKRSKQYNGFDLSLLTTEVRGRTVRVLRKAKIEIRETDKATETSDA